MSNKKKLITFLIIAIVIVIGMRAIKGGISASHKYDAFAECIAKSGAKFYGAFWCPHCQAQKKMFGASESLLPYVECSTPDGSDQTQICKDENIASYPTWILADGTRLQTEGYSGVSLETLSEKTNCPLPQ